MVLDVLLQAQATTMPDLAFRYGCRARNCGVAPSTSTAGRASPAAPVRGRATG